MMDYSPEFEVFWAHYPLRKDKGHAAKSFAKVAEHLPAMLEAIEAQELEREARASAGLFVPPWKYPGTWLNGRCWEDEVEDVPRNGNDPNRCPRCGEPYRVHLNFRNGNPNQQQAPNGQYCR